jgi:predicted AAA+ superfamily ATPase
MIKRVLEEKIIQLAQKFPVVSVTGPRQSGKTTLIRSLFPAYLYESLEEPDIRLLAESDPRRFLKPDAKMIIDEIQRVPELFSYIQTITDKAKINGQFIISGSQSFLLNQHISQSLAGRVAILNLMPLSLSELANFGLPIKSYSKLILRGFYPRLYDQDIDQGDFFPNYIQTYVERDVRLLQNVHDLTLFVRFLKLCAGRTGQLLNLNSLANDCGISPNTTKSWISVLETSFIIFLLQPHYRNFNKRIVKTPKLYFYDTGLACSLLEIRTENQLSTHYLRGALFENLILAEFIKKRFNKGLRNNCYFWRDNKGIEIDCIVENGDKLIPVEIKSADTYNKDFFKNLNYWNNLSDNPVENSFVIYGGDSSRDTKEGNLLSWHDIERIPII